MKKKNGFTLPEVLGTIVVLALIALLVTPVVSKTIKNNKQKLYNIQIKEIERAAKDYTLKNLDLLPEEGTAITITLEDLKMGGFIDAEVRNPMTKELFSDDLLIEIKNDNNQYVYTVLEDTYYVPVEKKALDESMMIAEVGSNGSVRKDNLGNPRYAGSDPNNYVCFGTQSEVCDDDHLYRIIGLIDGKMKLIKNSFYSERMVWDTNNSNNWDTSTLKMELNGANFYGNTSYIDETSKGYIENATWYISGQRGADYTLASFEDNERSSSSKGYIGLMSVTDLGYASNNVGCDKNTKLSISLGTANSECINNNYLVIDNSQWTIVANSSRDGDVWRVVLGGIVGNSVTNSNGVRPALFLTSNIKIKSGKGTSSSPYRLTK